MRRMDGEKLTYEEIETDGRKLEGTDEITVVRSDRYFISRHRFTSGAFPWKISNLSVTVQITVYSW